MSGLALVLSGFALLLMWVYERITTAPVVEDESYRPHWCEDES